MIVKIYPQNPNPKSVAAIVDILNRDGVIVYPTDTVYAFGCSIKSPKAIEKIKSIRGRKENDMAIVCADIASVSEYAKVDKYAYGVMKRNLPGPFTFILKASGKVPDKFFEKRKEVGVRIPGNEVTLAIVRELGCPLVTTSAREDKEVVEYTTDPELIHERFGGVVDAVVDSGYGNNEASTVVEIGDGECTVLREGLGELDI